MAETEEIRELKEEISGIKEKMVTKDFLESLVGSVEILSDVDALERIKSSEKDIDKGDTKEVRSVNDLL